VDGDRSGFYKLQTVINGGPVAVIDIGNGGTVLDPGNHGSIK